MQKLIKVYNLGRLEYNKCLKIQKSLVQSKLLNSSSQDSLILVEHDPIYTIGIRRNGYKQDEINRLKSLNAQVEFTDRGGLITFHGPGQLVAYPILNLKNYKPSLKWYVSQLEQIIIDLCKENFNLKANRMCNIGYTGVWINDCKIAAIGIHSKSYITYHGIALNCNVDLNWFNQIVPCGIQDKQVGSLSSLVNANIDIDMVKPMFLNSFKNVLNADIEMASSNDIQDLFK